MWIARNKTGDLCLFTGATPPVRNKPLDNPHSQFWGYNMNSDDGVIPLFKSCFDETYNDSVFEEMFKNLKWEDEPIEVGIFNKETQVVMSKKVWQRTISGKIKCG